ncbi:hypothetical protein [Rhodopirellula sallentina]|uniref:Secreted protein n=1 Tax=Rhodopirellula sallentina SM41 TaxID=1263870 RepID=M5U3C0_9BACT|nr:hypothetical protein [Rhodopirellula sallentina]EMI52356.1 secreted protein [Rhodopirellula sallentina SM41]
MKSISKLLLLFALCPAALSTLGCGSSNEVIEVNDAARSAYDEAGARAESMAAAAMKEDR